MVKRIDPSTLASSDPDCDFEKFADIDYKIKTGECPNGCGLMFEDEGQYCKTCGFATNIKCQLSIQ